jgi:copper resistance protein C
MSVDEEAMRTVVLSCLALCVLLHVSRAGAHAFLEQATPPVGGTVSTPPMAIGLRFSEAIEPAFSHIKLATKAGDAVEIGPVSLDPNDSTRLVAAVRSPLAPGAYKVSWRVVSVDTHSTEGDYTFEVKP